MFIKSIIIDGFKSYGTRTEINGFDQSFNAITGLNGTGKSNILDSICFVLGITNLTNVRARTLQDLIYKSGQAGITKASVTIVFDNSDSSKSPLTYEYCEEITVSRQIALGGKNRYLINGCSVTNKVVTDFFNSVQLNVNNPHFLIMQGRITKVLNMKPAEILAMIEEAAGTRMYENKKAGAQKTIDKKDNKVKEITEIVEEEINPKLVKLNDERMSYMEFQKMEKDYEHANRIYTAWQFLQIEDSKASSTKAYTDLVERNQEVIASIGDVEKQVTELTASINKLQEKMDTERSGVLATLEAELREVKTKEAKAMSHVKMCEDDVLYNKKNTQTLEKSIADDQKVLDTRKSELDKVRHVFETLKENEQKDSEALVAIQNKIEAISSGVYGNKDGDTRTPQQQLMEAKSLLSVTDTEIKKLNLQLKYERNELDSKKPKLKKTEDEYIMYQKETQMKMCEVKSLKEHLDKMDYQDGHLESLEEEMRKTTIDMRNSQEKMNNLERRYPRMFFEYTDPVVGFDRSKVKGVLIKLFTVKDPIYARALEIAAGSRLYNIVVDSDATASLIMSNCVIPSRVTFAPLNKIQAPPMADHVIQRAKELVGRDNAFCAKELVSYDPIYEPIIDWVFGQAFICTTIDVAEKIVARDGGINKKAITLEGDSFDPTGVISGGAMEHDFVVLTCVPEVVATEREINHFLQKIAQLKEEINICKPTAKKYQAMKHRYDNGKMELEFAEGRLESSTYNQLKKDIESIEASIDAKEKAIADLSEGIKEKYKTVAELEAIVGNYEVNRKKAMQEAQEELKLAKMKAEKSRSKWKVREEEYGIITLEIEELQKAVEKGEQDLKDNHAAIAQLEEKVTTAKEALKEIQAEVKAAKDKVKTQKDEISQHDKEIQKLTSEKDKLVQQVADYNLEILSIQNQLHRAKADMEYNVKFAADMRKKNKWIDTEYQFFGKPNGLYDFEIHNPREAQNKLRRLTEMKEKFGNKVNLKAIEILNTKEDQFYSVINKKQIIENDKNKILSVIGELDIKKEDVIKKAWDKVNHDFNSILSSLLPGAHAQLKPPSGCDFMDGLEVKVGFGGIWKDSLDELSGGQRSLVALSLILSMLLFKPAPIYILDEVDAALDPSHTQNIGQMLRSHFKQSQFIVVSLKDGMFNNANVIFRTKFVDGVSCVTMTTNTEKPGK